MLIHPNVVTIRCLAVTILLVCVCACSLHAQRPTIAWADRHIDASDRPGLPWIERCDDGRVIVNTGASVQIWSAEGGLLRAIGELQQLRPTVGESADAAGAWLVMASLDWGTLWTVDAKTGRRRTSMSLERNEPVRTLFTPDGSSLLLIGASWMACRSLPDLVERWSILIGASDAMFDARISHDGRRVVHFEDGFVTVREMSDGRLHRRYISNEEPRAVGFGDSARLVVAYTGCRILTWNIDDGELRQVVDDRSGPCAGHAMTLDRTGTILVTWSWWRRAGDSTIRVWTPVNGARTHDFGAPSVDLINAAWISRDLRELVALTDFGFVVTLDLESGQPLRRFPRHAYHAIVAAAAGADDGRTFAVAGAGVRRYDSSGAVLNALGPAHNFLSPLGSSRDGAVYSAADWDRLKVWALDSGGSVIRSFPTRSVLASAISGDGTLVALTEGSTVALMEVASGRLVDSLRGGASSVTHLEFSADSRRLAAGRNDGSVEIWDLDARGLPRRVWGGLSGVIDLDVDDPLRTIALDRYRQLAIWTGADSVGTRVRLAGDSVSTFDVSPDGRTLVTGGDSIYLYALPTVSRIGAFADSLDYRRGSYRVTILRSLDGIISTSTDGDVIRWRATGMLAPLSAPTTPTPPSTVTRAAVTDGVLRLGPADCADAVRATVHDRMGRLAARRTIELAGGARRLDLGGLPFGTYAVSLLDSDGRACTRILVLLLP